MKSRDFIRSSFIYTIVGSLPYASGFLLLPWLTENLTPEQFGINALYISLMYLVQIVASFGLETAISTIYFEHKEDAGKLRAVIGTIFLGVIIIGGFTLIFFISGGFNILTYILGGKSYLNLVPFGLMTIISAIFNAIFKVYSTLLIYRQQPIKFFTLNITNFIVTVLATLILLYIFPFTLYGPILGRLIPAFVSAFIVGVSLMNEYGLSWDRTVIKEIFRLTLPLFIYSFLSWIVNYIDRFLVLGILKDPTVVGVYDIAIKLVLFLDLIMAGLVSTINPHIFGIWKAENSKVSTPEINRYYSGLTAFFMLMVPLFVLLAPFIVPIFIRNPIYLTAFPYIGILSIGFLTRVWFYMFMAPIVFFKNTRSLPKVLLFSSVFEIGVGLLPIKQFGIQGMVWTFFLVKLVQAFFM